jgi:hypothetical protein
MIEDLEIDGVAVAFVRRPGPLSAGLTFRVGQADESLANRGITHLVEHLALFSLGLTDYHSNGHTGSLFTNFHMHGSLVDVPDFFASVCTSLANLPLQRLETEKAILRTEESGQSLGPAGQLPLWRYGAQGYGLTSYPEWGLERLTGTAVSEWANSWFTRENAALWIVGEDIPDNLRLPLPAGARRAVPAPTSALPVTPAYFADGTGMVLLDTLVRRTSAATVFGVVLERELFRYLRQEGGYSYMANTSYEPRDAETAHLMAFADALPEKMDAVLGGFVDVLARVRLGQFDESVVVAAKARLRESFVHPDIDAMRVAGYSSDQLIGARNRPIEELREELEAVTAADIHAVAIEALGSALLQVPAERTAEWAGFTQAPLRSVGTLEGNRHNSLDDSDYYLTSGAQGVSVTGPDTAVSVRFNDCVGQLRWPDGKRLLVGRDGFNVTVEPTLWAIDEAALEHIDSQVDPWLVIPMPAREPTEIPQPDLHKSTLAKRLLGRSWPNRSLILLVLLSLLSVLWVGGAVAATIDALSDRGNGNGVGVILRWVITAMAVWPVIRMVRSRRP